MHTIIVIGAGLGLLALLTLLTRGDAGRAMHAFLPLWAAASIGNMVYGVLVAGYGWTEEAPILLVVFGVPALVAVALARLRR